MAEMPQDLDAYLETLGVVSPVAAVGDRHVAFGDTWSDRRVTATGRGEQAEQEPD